VLSYRHGFHAGNPADVFKHSVLLALIRAMQEKPAGISFIDTHAGPALYDLTSDWAHKTREFEAGIQRLWTASLAGQRLHPALVDYLSQVADHNPDGQLRFYPGSPSITAGLLRPVDRLILGELHPAEQQALRERFAGQRRVTVECADGYGLLTRHLPPPTGRGLVLIDPSYELRDEIDTLVSALGPALKRFAHGVYLIWYPLIEGREIAIDRLPFELDLAADAWLDLRLDFPAEQRLGRMHGCGMALINPPWRARGILSELTEQGFGGQIHDPGLTRTH